MKELVKIIASPLEMLVLFSTTLHIICETFIDRTLHTVCAHTHNFFHWLFFENGKLLKNNLFIFICYLWLCWVFVAACGWAFSNCREQGLLCRCSAWASAVEHRL